MDLPSLLLNIYLIKISNEHLHFSLTMHKYLLDEFIERMETSSAKVIMRQRIGKNQRIWFRLNGQALQLDTRDLISELNGAESGQKTMSISVARPREKDPVTTVIIPDVINVYPTTRTGDQIFCFLFF